jgi:hypothetical protein
VSSVEPDQHTYELNASDKRVGEFVEACGDASVLLELSKKALDKIALAVEGKVGFARFFSVRFGRDYGGNAARLEACDEGVRVIALVSEDRSSLDLFEQRLGLFDIMHLALRNRKYQRVAEGVDDRMDLCAQTAAGAPDGLVAAVFF